MVQTRKRWKHVREHSNGLIWVGAMALIISLYRDADGVTGGHDDQPTDSRRPRRTG